MLAAVNIEQSKLLDLEDLQKLIGRVLYTPYLQRQSLSALADEGLLREILRVNARGLNASDEESFYYDPHTKHYTGMSKVLAGWCPGIRLADKALHSDFIHTLKGYPVYFASTDNYEDIRERFIPNCEAMLELVQLPADKKVSIYVDRAIAAEWFTKPSWSILNSKSLPGKKVTRPAPSPSNGSTGSCACSARATMPKISKSIIFAISGAPGRKILNWCSGSWRRPIQKSNHYREHPGDRSAGPK